MEFIPSSMSRARSAFKKLIVGFQFIDRNFCSKYGSAHRVEKLANVPMIKDLLMLIQY